MVKLATATLPTTSVSGVSSMELRVLEHPPQLWHNSQLCTSAQILSMIIDNWQLLPTINLLASKIRSLNSVFSSSLGLKQPSSCSVFVFKNAERRGVVNVLGAWLNILRARDLAPPSFKSWIRHCNLLHVAHFSRAFYASRGTSRCWFQIFLVGSIITPRACARGKVIGRVVVVVVVSTKIAIFRDTGI